MATVGPDGGDDSRPRLRCTTFCISDKNDFGGPIVMRGMAAAADAAGGGGGPAAAAEAEGPMSSRPCPGKANVRDVEVTVTTDPT